MPSMRTPGRSGERRRARALGLPLLASVVLIAGSAEPTLAGSATTSADPVVAAAGDIAESGGHQQATGNLIRSLAPTAVLPLGDEAYADGSLSQFKSYYDPAWGSFDAIASPTPGNHEYHTSGAAGYFAYFGARAPAPYYSFNLGSWHLISLNSEISYSAGSAQERWLKADLAAHPAPCTLAYWHRPRFDSGTEHGSDSSLGSLWNDLYAGHADIVLTGHEHHYERFALQSPSGVADPAGLREIVVGTGGAALYNDFGTPLPTSQVRDGTHFGVLKLTLHAGSYDWAFIATGGSTRDSGTTGCHRSGAPPPPPPHPKRCVVPRVIGFTLARAKQRIRSRGCTVGRIRRVHSRRVGRVLAQSPRPDVTKAGGFRVRLVVGRR